jgi:hypothetical protein
LNPINIGRDQLTPEFLKISPNDRMEDIAERLVVKKAMALGREFREDPVSISADEQARRQKVVGNQRAQAVPRNGSPLRQDRSANVA